MEKPTFNTQQIRLHLIRSLIDLFNDLEPQAHSSPEAAKVLGFIAQVLNSLCRSYDDRELDEELKTLEALIKKIRGGGHGAEEEENPGSH